MSNEKVLAALFEHIEINKSYYFEGAYYRLKDYGDHIYGLQRAIPGMCGEKTASPSIKFYWKNGVLDYQFYVDFEASPMIMKALVAPTMLSLSRLLKIFCMILRIF